ncbi:ABC transporter substrate-binding protein [Bradyrhizobium sp. B117]|uniref:ABC transporter substrate-binding protein n=1 Tax=Bradyrhizobium sp. B117 TaxID=3140246 RepID=UPI003182E4D7
MRKSLIIASALTITGLAAAMLVPTKPAFAADLTIVSYGGAAQAAARKTIYEPFSKVTGITFSEDEYNGEIAKIRAMVQSGTVSWDVVEIGEQSALSMCAEDIIETIDWRKLSIGRDKFIGGNAPDCGVPTFSGSTIIAFDKDKLANGPKIIADLFDTRKFPGKRGLAKRPWDNLEWALIADGVAINDVYKVLRTSQGVDRAFEKLDTIKKDVVWWVAGAQPPQLLADGQVVMTSSYNGRIADANKNSGKHFAIVWDAQAFSRTVWIIPKGSAHRENAYKFLDFASSPQVQANLPNYISYGPTNKEAMALVNPASLANLPTAPENMGNTLFSDAAFWSERRDELTQRFTAWLAK